jgi:hypothetical protein
MGGNIISSPRSLTCENVADLVDSLGDSYTIYRPSILKYAIDGAILVEYSSVDNYELNSFFVELEVKSGIHRLKFKNCIRALADEKNHIADASKDTPAPPLPARHSVQLVQNSIPSVVTPLKLPDGNYHVFLTHDWGEKGINHRRVSKVNQILKEKYELITWFDEDRMDGDIRTTMTEGIENSMVMIIFITQRYQKKVIDGGSDNRDNCKVRVSRMYHSSAYCFPYFFSLFRFLLYFCCLYIYFSSSLVVSHHQFEFKFGLRSLGHNKVIPVVMEERMRDTSLWKGLLNSEVGSLLYVDMTSDDELIFFEKCEELYRRIACILHLNAISLNRSQEITASLEGTSMSESVAKPPSPPSSVKLSAKPAEGVITSLKPTGTILPTSSVWFFLLCTSYLIRNEKKRLSIFST